MVGITLSGKIRSKAMLSFALVAGDLQYVQDHFTTMSGRKVALRLFTEAHNIDQCDHAMISLKKIHEVG